MMKLPLFLGVCKTVYRVNHVKAITTTVLKDRKYVSRDKLEILPRSNQSK